MKRTMKTTPRVIAIALILFTSLMLISACSSPDNKYTAAPFKMSRIDGTTAD